MQSVLSQEVLTELNIVENFNKFPTVYKWNSECKGCKWNCNKWFVIVNTNCIIKQNETFKGEYDVICEVENFKKKTISRLFGVNIVGLCMWARLNSESSFDENEIEDYNSIHKIRNKI